MPAKRGKVHVLGYPFAGGQKKPGPELTPDWLFQQDWFLDKTSRGLMTVENVPVSNSKSNRSDDSDVVEGHRPGAKNWTNIASSSDLLASSTEAALRHGSFVLVVGGDHSQAIGSIAGLKAVHPDARVLWVDAHVDANTPAATPSGNVHGMPVAVLTGLAPECQRRPVLRLTDIAYFGIRSYSRTEIAMIQAHRIPFYRPAACLVDRLPAIKKELESRFAVRGRRPRYWISLDVDAIDCDSFASTGAPKSAGLSVEFVLRFLEAFLPDAVGMDLTEINFLEATSEQAERDMGVCRAIVETVVRVVQEAPRDGRTHANPPQQFSTPRLPTAVRVSAPPR